MRDYITESTQFRNLIIEFEEHIDCMKYKKYSLFTNPCPAMSDIAKIGFLTEDNHKKIKPEDRLMPTFEKQRKYGTMCKPGRFFQKICKEGTSPQIIAEFAAKYNNLFSPIFKELKFEFKTARFAYDSSNFFKHTGPLGSSCMTSVIDCNNTW